MKDLWKIDWPDSRNGGIYLRFSKNVDKELRSVIMAFSRWLRWYYHFPIKVMVYVKDAPYILTQVNKERGVASIFLPYDKSECPYIRLATGDYNDLVKEKGETNAKCSIICSMAHEITHYYQWLRDDELDETQATRKAIKIVYKYLDDCEDIE